MSLTSVDLPEPDTPGHRREHAQRERHVDLAQVVFARTDHGQLTLAVGRAPDGRDLDALLARKIGAGERIRVGQQLVVGAAVHDRGHRARRRAGPMSTTQSAWAMVSRSCSTTISVLPRSLSRMRVSISRRLSR